MKFHPLLFFSLLTFFSCKKSEETLKNTCFSCSYTTESKKVNTEVCDDTNTNQIEKMEMRERMQKQADALNVGLVCSEN